MNERRPLKPETRLNLLRLCLSLCVMLPLLVEAQEYEQAYKKTEAEYNSVVESVSQTQEKINDARSALIKAARGTLEAFDRVNPDPEAQWEMRRLLDPSQQTDKTKGSQQ